MHGWTLMYQTTCWHYPCLLDEPSVPPGSLGPIVAPHTTLSAFFSNNRAEVGMQFVWCGWAGDVNLASQSVASEHVRTGIQARRALQHPRVGVLGHFIVTLRGRKPLTADH